MVWTGIQGTFFFLIFFIHHLPFPPFRSHYTQPAPWGKDLLQMLTLPPIWLYICRHTLPLLPFHLDLSPGQFYLCSAKIYDSVPSPMLSSYPVYIYNLLHYATLDIRLIQFRCSFFTSLHSISSPRLHMLFDMFRRQHFTSFVLSLAQKNLIFPCLFFFSGSPNLLSLSYVACLSLSLYRALTLVCATGLY